MCLELIIHKALGFHYKACRVSEVSIVEQQLGYSQVDSPRAWAARSLAEDEQLAGTQSWQRRGLESWSTQGEAAPAGS